jgi:O-methyltransferase
MEIDAFVARCRAMWQEAGLELTEQQRFDMAEALAGMVYPDYRFSEFARMYLKDSEFARFYRDYVSTDNFHSYDRKYLLQEILKLCRRVPGDTAECGVYEGAGSYLIGRHAARLGRLHHMFDSFEGLSQPEAIDGTYWKRGAMSVPENRVRARLKDLDNLRYWRGWIPERYDEVADRRFSFVHVDVDLYQPTSDSVAFFYPRVNHGGLILFDDYGFATCPGARRGIDEFFAGKPEPIIDLPTGQAFVMIGG